VLDLVIILAAVLGTLAWAVLCRPEHEACRPVDKVEGVRRG
jgi:hypothetical protein